MVPAILPARPEVDVAPLDGHPVAGSNLLADARLTVAPGEATLRLRRPDGSLIEELASVAIDPRRFRAALTIPSEPFVLEISGRTAAGNAFLRQFPVAAIPRTVGIRATPDLVVIAPGSSGSFEVAVTNATAARATYNLQVSRTLGWPVVVPPVFGVDPGGTVTVNAQVTVPAGTPEGTRNDITLQVQDPTSPTARNSTSVAILAGPTNRSPECGAALPSIDRLWPPNHEFVDVSVLGVTDPDDDTVTVTVTGITQDEAVNAPGSGNTAPDGAGGGTLVARVRAERAGGGDGRVYAIAFSADDGKGATCSGSVHVGVPHSVKGTPVDSGQLYDSSVVP